jgi:hypothetical protein
MAQAESVLGLCPRDLAAEVQRNKTRNCDPSIETFHGRSFAKFHYRRVLALERERVRSSVSLGL